jgi:CRISPR/Cas system-associated endonuclease/helicase Cas3
MSDENNTPELTEEEIAVEPQGEQDSTDWKAEARKWEKRAKDANSLKEAADKWAEYERSLKPEQERIAEELAQYRNEAESAKVKLIKYEVATEYEIPAEAVKLLQGSTREELEESANTLLALIANQSKPKTPKPDMSQGKPAGSGMTTADMFANALDDIL